MNDLGASLAGWTNFGATASLGSPTGAGWHTVADLASDGARFAGEVASVYGSNPTVGATFLLARTARSVAEPCLHALLDARCLPRVRPDAVTVHLNGNGRIDGVAFREAGEARADATLLASALVDSFRDVVEAFRALVPVGRRGLWGLVSDAVGGGGVSLASRHPGPLGVTGQVLDELERLHGFGARPTWRDRDGVVDLLRGSCCMAFQLEEHGYCDACPVGRRAATS